MRWIITWGRDFDDYEVLKRAAGKAIRPGDVIISGGAKGADSLGELFAERNNLELERYPAEWDKYGKGAGFRRNHRMSLIADGCLAFWDGKSGGTKNMIENAHKARLTTLVVYYEVPTQGKIKDSGDKR
jgi:hypothetical protein